MRTIAAAAIAASARRPGAARAGREAGGARHRRLDDPVRGRRAEAPAEASGARVPSDAQISTGLSKPSLLNWPRYAGRPGAPLPPARGGGVPRRERRLPDARAPLLRQALEPRVRPPGRADDGRLHSGAGVRRVYWLQLPQARGGDFRKAYPAVNKGVRLAAKRRRKRVRDRRAEQGLHPARALPRRDALPRPHRARAPARRHPPLARGRRRSRRASRSPAYPPRPRASLNRGAAAGRAGAGRGRAAAPARPRRRGPRWSPSPPNQPPRPRE